MFNLYHITKENKKQHNKKWPYIPDHAYRVLIIGDSGSEKASALLSLTSQPDNSDNFYLYAKDLSIPKYEFLIEKREDNRIKLLNDSNAFIECSSTIDDVYEKIDDYNANRER